MKAQYAVMVTFETYRAWVANRTWVAANVETDRAVYATRMEAEKVRRHWAAKPGVISADIWEL